MEHESEFSPEKIRSMSAAQFVAGFRDYHELQSRKLAEAFDEHFFGERPKLKIPDGIRRPSDLATPYPIEGNVWEE